MNKNEKELKDFIAGLSAEQRDTLQRHLKDADYRERHAEGFPSYRELQAMSKEERLQWVFKLKELPDSLYYMLPQEGCLTGSTMYGGPKADPADIDWVINCPAEVFKGYTMLAGRPGYNKEDSFTALYAHHKGKLLNIICVSSPYVFNSWCDTTDILEKMVENPLIANLIDIKWKRVRLFRAIQDVLMPPTRLVEPMDRLKAINRSKCTLCGKEAVNFTCALERRKYLLTGICERCNAASPQDHAPTFLVEEISNNLQ